SSPNDPQEAEADRVADAVMRMEDPGVIQRACAKCDEDDKVQRQEDGEDAEQSSEEEDLGPVPLKAAGTPGPVSAATAAQVGQLRDGGQPLATDLRSFYEPRFGHDFSRVRIQSGADAAESAKKLNALAYTTGSTIVFGSGQYSPGTATGRRLLAHELTHVVQ